MPSDPLAGQVNLGRVIFRSFHSITPDLAKPPSQRRDLCGSGAVSAPLRTCSTSYATVAALLQRNSVASTHMRWSTTPNLRARATLGALHASAFRHVESPALQAREAGRTRQHDVRRFKERGSHHGVADFADTAVPVGLT